MMDVSYGLLLIACIVAFLAAFGVVHRRVALLPLSVALYLLSLLVVGSRILMTHQEHSWPTSLRAANAQWHSGIDSSISQREVAAMQGTKAVGPIVDPGYHEDDDIQTPVDPKPQPATLDT